VDDDLPTAPVLEAEALVRLLFAENGTLADLHAALDQFAQDATDLYQQVATINTSYLQGGHPFPERTHLSVLFATFQLELFDLITRWVTFAKAEIDTWPSTRDVGMTDRIEKILQLISEHQPILGSDHRPIASSVGGDPQLESRDPNSHRRGSQP